MAVHLGLPHQEKMPSPSRSNSSRSTCPALVNSSMLRRRLLRLSDKGWNPWLVPAAPGTRSEGNNTTWDRCFTVSSSSSSLQVISSLRLSLGMTVQSHLSQLHPVLHKITISFQVSVVIYSHS